MKEMTMNEAAKLCYNLQQPIAISVDGKQKVYLMSENIFDEYADAKRIEEVLAGLDQIERGEGIDGDVVFRELEAKYGI